MKTRLATALRSVLRPIPKNPARPFWGNARKDASIRAADVQFGQPVHETHPHLLNPGELTPGITALEYHHRRAALAKQLPANSIAVLAAADLKYRSGSVFYEYHQDPYFLYLTGFNEPEAVAVIEKGQTDVEYTFHLFVRPKDEKAEKWDGARSGVQAAQDVFNADEAGDIGNIANILPGILAGANQVYTDIGSTRTQSAFERFVRGSPKVDGLAHALKSSSVRRLRPLINELRVNKSPAELDCMRRASDVSGIVMTQAMQGTYTSEKQLWADLSYGYRSQGLDGEAYVPVIAGGKNALAIHYVRNDELLADGEMVLVDAGGEYGGYISDITRSWPVNGRFTDAQKDMYSMILGVQKNCVSMCREDANMSLDKLHRICETGLREGLTALGFPKGHDVLDKLFPHHVGHYIGLDVHDAPGHSRNELLMQNQCITIEPGIYVPDEERWPEHFRGLGIRIEDSVVIGKTDVEVLTKLAVKEVDEIESLRA
jgi:intermediate cleaving peptidase 55